MENKLKWKSSVIKRDIRSERINEKQKIWREGSRGERDERE